MALKFWEGVHHINDLLQWWNQHSMLSDKYHVSMDRKSEYANEIV